jgi:hypothetical protein
LGTNQVLAIADGRARKDPCNIGPQLRLMLFDEHAIIPTLVDR